MINSLISKVEEHYDADIFLISTGIDDGLAERIHLWTHNDNVKRHKNALLMLCTYGGYPDAAYKIARSIQIAYNTAEEKKKEDSPQFYLFVNGPCKSAGTLIATGADNYLLTDAAEFGPIDAQIRKPDEAGERTSGLVTVEAFDPLRKQALTTFCDIFSHLRHDVNFALSSRMAAEIANNLTVGLLAPVYAQIDPLRVAELDRILRIGAGYAERLSHGNLIDGAIGILLARYPSHSFVIDRDEAKKVLFKNVEYPIDELANLGEYFCSLDERGLGNSFPVKVLSTPEKEADHVGQDNERDSQGAGGGEQEIGEDTN